jgi:hypothetical protein
MKISKLIAALALAPMVLSVVAFEGEPKLSSVTETLYISAGCPQDTPGTCTSTRWTGRTSGDSSSNFVTAITPADELLYRAEGSINWRDYPSDLSLRADGYLLDVARDLEIDVELSAQGVMANTTVHARASLRVCDTDETGSLVSCTNTTVTAVDQLITVTTLAAPVTVSFVIDLPDALAGKTLQRLTVELAVHGVHAAGGYINQQGGSPVRIPYLLALDA